MKKIKSFLQMIMSTCAVLGWWGFFYPELALTPDTVKVMVGDSEYSENAEIIANTGNEITDSSKPTFEYSIWDFDCSLYHELIWADRSQIVFRSKLLTDLSLFWEALQNGDK